MFEHSQLNCSTIYLILLDMHEKDNNHIIMRHHYFFVKDIFHRQLPDYFILKPLLVKNYSNFYDHC